MWFTTRLALSTAALIGPARFRNATYDPHKLPQERLPTSSSAHPTSMPNPRAQPCGPCPTGTRYPENLKIPRSRDVWIRFCWLARGFVFEIVKVSVVLATVSCKLCVCIEVVGWSAGWRVSRGDEPAVSAEPFALQRRSVIASLLRRAHRRSESLRHLLARSYPRFEKHVTPNHICLARTRFCSQVEHGNL